MSSMVEYVWNMWNSTKFFPFLALLQFKKMLNQVSVEAVYSATYVENYLDCVENLPDELQRLISRMRELDVCYLGKLW